ncbi:hypothetical protein ACSSUR_28005, partial [Pseudomonas cedrina]|uniref:hypothetical protein n=1 Tax=Pseudomonas cedrina TaxID=651740 RepID=UPI003ED849A3
FFGRSENLRRKNSLRCPRLSYASSSASSLLHLENRCSSMPLRKSIQSVSAFFGMVQHISGIEL